MDEITTSRHAMSERQMGIIDCALWDLLGRMAGLPVHKLLGGCRDQAKAYVSCMDHLGSPEAYAAHAVACKQRGFKGYKIHP